MSKYFNKIALIAVVGLAGVGLATADQWDKRTTITIDQPMQVPNVTLQPGTYVIKLVDSGGDRHIVQFFDKDEKHLVTTILAIPNERLRPTGKSVFAFWETPAGQPQSLRAWFYPGDNFGQEFAYPKGEASRISANNSGAAVPISDEKPADLANSTATATAAPAPEPAPVATAEPAPSPAPVEAAAVAPQNTPPAPAATNEAVNQAPASVDNSDAQRVTPTTQPDSLPKTASSLPLFALIGMLSIVAALALKTVYQRS